MPAFGAVNARIAGAQRFVQLEPQWWGAPVEDLRQVTATKLKQRALISLRNTHWSPENTLWYPIVVNAGALARYLTKMVCQRQGALYAP